MGCGRSAILAAAGLHALDHHVERLADDHEHARPLAEACGVDPATVDTNIVVVPMDDPARVVAAAREEGVLVSAVGATSLRMVTHLDVSPRRRRARRQGARRAVRAEVPLVAGLGLAGGGPRPTVTQLEHGELADDQRVAAAARRPPGRR